MLFIMLVIYGLIHIAPNLLLPPGRSEQFAVLAELCFWAVFLNVLHRKHLLGVYRICRPNAEICFSAMLLVIPYVQVCLFGFPQITALKLFLCIMAVFGEELLFRAWLPLIIERKIHFTLIQSALVCSALFGAFHLVNVLSSAAVPVVLLQALYAFCAGLALFMLAEKAHSIIPGVFIHTIINVFAAETAELSPKIIYCTFVVSAVCVFYSIIQYCNIRKKDISFDESIH